MLSQDEILRASRESITPSLWKILIVDDQKDVHQVTKLALKGMTFLSKPLKILSAYNAKEALDILSQNPDIALALVDVVMETQTSGLDLVRDIREKMGNHFVRLVLRTGLPQNAPEREIIEKYDINDYRSKTELTVTHLYTIVLTSLRTFALLFELEWKKLEYQHLSENLNAIVIERTAELNKLANIDPLTGVSNRRQILEAAEKELARSTRSQKLLSVLMFDLDKFKHVNDTYGHEAGDDVLKAFASSCQNMLRITDSFGRIGGEEFIALLPETSKDEAFVIANRIREQISLLNVPTPQGSIRFTVSIGVATFNPEQPLPFASILKQADAALYRAKKQGRNQVKFFKETRRLSDALQSGLPVVAKTVVP